MPPTLEKVHIPALNVSEGGEKGGRISKVCLPGSGWRAGLSFREVRFQKHVISNSWFECTGANGPASVLL